LKISPGTKTAPRVLFLAEQAEGAWAVREKVGHLSYPKTRK
jgi:hypothetical protein